MRISDWSSDVCSSDLKLTPEQRDRFDKIMATYAADITGMDKAVGTLIDRLKASGDLDNTLILFMSDNGGNAESGPDGRLKNAAVLGGPKSTTFVGMNWATLQNTDRKSTRLNSSH